MQIADRTLGPGHPALIIAEIGNNHDGSVRQAECLIEEGIPVAPLPFPVAEPGEEN